MTNYGRVIVAGATYFFTVNCAQRQGNRLLTENINLLRETFRKIKKDHPFNIDAIVILPDTGGADASLPNITLDSFHFNPTRLSSGLFNILGPMILAMKLAQFSKSVIAAYTFSLLLAISISTVINQRQTPGFAGGLT